MKPYLAVLLLLLGAPVPAAAQTYKWLDEHGVTNYGPKPPPGRPAQLVDTRLRNSIDTAPVPQVPHTDNARPATPVRAAPAPTPDARRVHGMEFDTYIRLRPGMTEGEVLMRAGTPDYVALEGVRDQIVKSFYYYPTPSDPFITIVTLRGGRTDNIERTRKH